MGLRSITVEEHAALQELETGGPSRALNVRVRGRLALYRLIDEGPYGGRIEPLSPQKMLFSLPPVLATAQNMAWAETE